MSELKVGAKVLYTGPRFQTEADVDEDLLTYGYNSNMAAFVVDRQPGTIQKISRSTVEVDGWSYAPHEIKVINPLPVKNRPAYAVVKNKEVLGMFELRADARKAKKSIGGKKAGVIIVAYAPVEEIR